MSIELYKDKHELARELQPLTEMKFQVILLSPVLLDDRATLRFAVGFQLEASDKLLGWMDGWRILNGKLIAPMRSAGKGYFPFWRFGSNRAEDVIVDLAQCWKNDFPTVRFPSGGEFKSERV